MHSGIWVTWFCAVSALLVLWGMIFAFFGLHILPVINESVLLSWESSIYGAVLIGCGTTLLLLGRGAYRRKDRELM